MAFSEKQREYLRNATRRWNVKTGATRSGKTFLDYTVIPKRIESCRGDGLIVLLGNTRGTLERNILDPMRAIWGGRLVGTISSANTVRIFGKKCYALGAEKVSQVSKLQGAGIEYCYGDEVTTWNADVFQMLKSRLSCSHSRFDGTCNPDNPRHWFKEFLDSDADIYHQHYTIDDNPFLEPAFVEALKKEYAGSVYYDRFILGKWAMAEGRIYDMFRPDADAAEDTEREYTAWYVSMDYGTQNPTAMLLWGRCGGVWYAVREYYHSGRESRRQKTDEEYYADLDGFIGGVPVRAVIVDPAAASMIACIRRHGKYRVLPAKNEVLDGIRSTGSALRAGTVRICRRCVKTLEEIEGYVWDAKAAEHGEDRPLKADDHAMDALRYFVQTTIKYPVTVR